MGPEVIAKKSSGKLLVYFFGSHDLYVFNYFITRASLTLVSAWIKENATKPFDEHSKELNKKPHEAHREIFKLGLKELAAWRKNPVYFSASPSSEVYYRENYIIHCIFFTRTQVLPANNSIVVPSTIEPSPKDPKRRKVSHEPSSRAKPSLSPPDSTSSPISTNDQSPKMKITIRILPYETKGR